MQVSGRKYTELTATELQTVENIVQANTYGSVYAESLLAMLNQTAIDRIPHKESTQSNKKANSTKLESITNVYPNPTSRHITIESKAKWSVLSIYDITGQFIQEQILVYGKNNLKMDFPNGTYFFQVKSDEGVDIHKIVVAK